MAGSAIAFTLNLIDRMSGPAKVATSALVQLNDQLKTTRDLIKDLPKLAIKVPKLGTEPATKTSEKLGPMFGPGRREQAAAEKYAASEKRKLDAASDALDKQRSAAQYADFQKQQRERAKAAADAERLTVGYHIKQIQRAQAEEKARRHAEESLGINRDGALKELLGAAGAGGPLGMAAEIKHLSAAFTEVTGLSAKAGIAIAAFGLVAIEAGKLTFEFAEKFADLVFEGATMAVEAAEIKQDTLDMLDAMLGSAEAAERTLEAIRGVTKVTSASQEAVQSSAQSLAAAGITNEKMLDGAVLAVAQVDSVLKGRGEKIESVFARAAQTGKFEINAKRLAGTGVQLQSLYEEIAARTGKGVKQIESMMKAGKVKAETGISALTAVINKKFGSVAAKQALDIGPQLKRLHSNISNLFEDVNTAPFLESLNRIVQLFDKSTTSGSALREMINGIFDPIFKAVEKVEPYVTIFFLGIELAALKVYNAVRRIAYAWGISFGEDDKTTLDAFEDSMIRFADAVGAVSHGMEVLASYTGVWETVGTYLGLLADLSWMLVQPFVLVEGLFFNIGAAALLAIDYISRFGDEGLRAGQSLVTGLINGIVSTASQLYDAVVNMAKTALQKFRDIFQIHSPSRVMAGMGAHISTGLAQGINAGARTSSAAMVGAGVRLSSGTAAGAQLGLLNQVPRSLAMNDNALADRSEPVRTNERSASSQGNRRGVVFEAGAFSAGAFQFGNVSNASELASQMEDVFANVMERAALMNGTS